MARSTLITRQTPLTKCLFLSSVKEVRQMCVVTANALAEYFISADVAYSATLPIHLIFRKQQEGYDHDRYLAPLANHRHTTRRL